MAEKLDRYPSYDPRTYPVGVTEFLNAFPPASLRSDQWMLTPESWRLSLRDHWRISPEYAFRIRLSGRLVDIYNPQRLA